MVGAGRTPLLLRGFDYQPVALVAVHGRVRQYRNETFDPAYYRHGAVEAMLARYEAEGYNAIRVFLGPGRIGSTTGRGLDASYLADVADLVRSAASHKVRTILTIGALPAHGGFAPAQVARFGKLNEDYLDPAYLAAERRYLQVLVAGLRRDRVDLSSLLFELKGEQSWDNQTAPLSWHSGQVRTADGRTYDMASAASRRAMENDNLAHWTNTLATSLHRLAPHSLVGVGVYPPSVHRPSRTVRPGVLFEQSTKNDFVDIHTYPNLGNEATQIASFHAGRTRKPVIMGEFGATRKTPLAAAATELVHWQARSCHLGGLSMSGWLLWTWNSKADLEFWDALAGHGRLEHALAPSNRPRPCSP